MPRLENWSIGYGDSNGFTAPELVQKTLHGMIYDDQRFLDGTNIRTSDIQFLDLENNIATTRNTTYKLGNINPDYQKFINQLKENNNE